MEGTLFKILEILNASPADYVILVIILMIAIWAKSICRRLKIMERKYHSLDKSNVRLWDRVDPDMVKDHHSGDYEIKTRKK